MHLHLHHHLSNNNNNSSTIKQRESKNNSITRIRRKTQKKRIQFTMNAKQLHLLQIKSKINSLNFKQWMTSNRRKAKEQIRTMKSSMSRKKMQERNKTLHNRTRILTTQTIMLILVTIIIIIKSRIPLKDSISFSLRKSKLPNNHQLLPKALSSKQLHHKLLYLLIHL